MMTRLWAGIAGAVGRINLVMVAIVLTMPATAQTVDSDAAAIEEIVVTGSHVRRSQFEGRVPLQTVNMADIERIGAFQTMDVLKMLSINNGSQTVTEQDAAAGTAQFNIRGLGFSSTLTLVNGRRAGVSTGDDGSGQHFVDINQFPIAMIERVEVLKDGASATYGSDAVAGVVNIITRKDFEGIEVSGDYRSASNEAYSLNLALGSSFDRGRFGLYASQYWQTLSSRLDFDWLDERINGDGDLGFSRLLSGTGAPGNYTLANGGTVPFADPDCTAALGVFRRNPDGSLDESLCRFDFSGQIPIISDEDRTQVFAEANYAVNDKVTAYGEAGYSRNVIDRPLGGPGWAGAPFFIPGSHPFNFFIEDPANPGQLSYVGPENWDSQNMQAVDIIANARPLTKIYNANQQRYGDLYNVRTFNTTRLLAGMEVDLSDDWLLDISYVRNVSETVARYQAQFKEDILRQATIDGDFNFFGTSIATPGLISPKDGTSVAANSEDVLARVLSTGVETATTEQDVLDFILSGSALDFGSGPLGFAVGVQHRRLYEFSAPDSLRAAEENGVPGLQFPREGEQEVRAVFAESVIPVLDVAEIQLALRHEDYDDVGSTTDPKISASFRPTDWLNIRGSYGTSFQAPTIRQSAESLGSATLNDEVQLVNGVLTCTGDFQNFTASVINRGAPDLSPQTSDNISVGFTANAGQALRASVDYWSYDYTNLIAQNQTAQAIVSEDCADDGIPNDPRVIRDGAGQLRGVETLFINVGSVETNGLDLALSYGLDAGAGGLLTVDARASWINEFSVDTDGSGQEFDGVGSRNFSNSFHTIPEWRGNAGLSWQKGSHAANVTAYYIDGYTNDQSNNAPIDSMTTVDLNYTLSLNDMFGGEETVLSIGVNNVFDEDPPALRRADANGNLITQADDPINYIDRPSYDQFAGHSLLGRIAYVRVKQRF